jgi:hypothetical protein
MPRENPRDSRYKFLSAFYSSNHGLRKTLGKIWRAKTFLFQRHPNFSAIRPTSLFYDWKKIPSDRLCIVHHIAQSSLKISPCISSNSNMCRYPHETYITATSCQLPTFLFTLVHERDAARFLVIPLPLSSSYCRLRSSTFSFSIWSIAMRIAANSAVKTLAGSLIRNPILLSIVWWTAKPVTPSISEPSV